MWCRVPGLTARLTRKAAIQHFSGVMLCALLLFFSTNAKLSRYDVHKPILKAFSSQAYFDGEEIRKETSKIAPLLFFFGVIAGLLLVCDRVTPLPLFLSSSSSFKGFDPEVCLRPPPAQ
jgi:hypothetical protein